MSFDTRRSQRRTSSSAVLVSFVLIIGATVLLLAVASAQQKAANEATEDEVRARCGTACHKLPPPDILPRAAWRAELVSMMLIQEGMPEPPGAGALVPLPPDWLRILRYYEARAPEALPAPQPWPPPASSSPSSSSASGGVSFKTHTLSAPDDRPGPAIANVRLLDLDADGAPEMIASDMRGGRIVAAKPGADARLSTIARLRNPSHIEMVDLDRDGRRDLLVADLGSFPPSDHQNGAVYWLHRERAVAERFTPVLLAKGLGRVADARAADFDGDRDLDVLLAVFGWRRTGNIVLLENQTRDWTKPTFVPRVIDTRTGAIHVPIAHLRQDGRFDFAALFAQEHESIVAFLNLGGKTGPRLAFETETIYAAPHPNWGSSGIELVDLDKDGDLDVLYTYGDTLDDFRVKPYHGLMWLENRGAYPFTPHALATLPGAHRALAADLDLDGDLDIVATAMVSGGGGDLEPTLASLVWLEQTGRGVFERRTLEMGHPYHATLDVADYDGDGDPDIAVGWFAPDKPITSWIDIWENLARARRSAAR